MTFLLFFFILCSPSVFKLHGLKSFSLELVVNKCYVSKLSLVWFSYEVTLLNEPSEVS